MRLATLSTVLFLVSIGWSAPLPGVAITAAKTSEEAAADIVSSLAGKWKPKVAAGTDAKTTMAEAATFMTKYPDWYKPAAGGTGGGMYETMLNKLLPGAVSDQAAVVKATNKEGMKAGKTYMKQMKDFVKSGKTSLDTTPTPYDKIAVAVKPQLQTPTVSVATPMQDTWNRIWSMVHSKIPT